MNIVFDAEADVLLDTVTKCHCACIQVLGGDSYSFGPSHKPVWELLTWFKVIREPLVLIGHNIIKYDFQMFKKVYGWELPKGIAVLDTLVLSQLLNPDRPTPLGCSKGPHSIEAWGIRLKRHKPEHEDWSKYSPEMLHRCKEDVEINCLVLEALLQEAGVKTTEELLEWV